ncbi:MAG: RNA polymerase-associated protein RapA [candidate division WS2 bacterium]|nr:RNA polymerase-associated protein RapA [Candidatus Lithacetigena glycinireducens]MBT9174998.1 RNA polymerase-associated protein RapA [Candidatus Lithacetigena glycinireducens]
MDTIKEGDVVEGPFWSEPFEIKKISYVGEYIHIIGATIYTHKYDDQLFTEEQILKLRKQDYILDFSSPGEEAFLALESKRYKLASLYDPLLAMSVSRIDPLPFQIEAVYGYILKLPRIRFLIADDPGAGKTIMAGLIIKELKLRGLARRILIIPPGHLKDQWRRELKEKFQESFTVVDRSTLDSLYAENPWQKESQVITSIDFAKRDDILPILSGVNWDLIIVDEAHKMAAYKYGEKFSKTERYKLGELLSKNSEHLLFLTATPHKGDPENYRLFLDLLIPGFFATQQMVAESINNKDNPLFIRRLKEDLKDFEGKPIFTGRFPKTIKFRLSDEEKDLYNQLSKYVISQYNLALKSDKKRNIAFALLILQRRLASSTYALYKSLMRRKERLETMFNIANQIGFERLDPDEYEDADEQRRWELENKWEALTIAENKEELVKEISIIDNLISKAWNVLNEESEVKLGELKEAVSEGFIKIEEIQGNKKILIFTESKDTMEYLQNKLKSWGYKVNAIHGGMNQNDRVDAEKIFKNETEIMVATEAAGEGINLQFCHLMINYDIPWNPNRLEQRMGRIHRYGQNKDVFVFNMVAEDTREGEVLTKLFDKLEEIRTALGSDRVFDVIGDTFLGINLYQLMIEAVVGARNMEETIKELDIKIDEEYIKKIKEVLGESLATRYIDYSRIKEMAEKAKENRLIPEYLEEFFKDAWGKVEGKFRTLKDKLLALDSVPFEIRKFSDEVDFKNRYGPILRTYPKVTFDKAIAFSNPDEVEFISFGHPLLEALLEWVEKKYFSSLQKGAVFKDPSGRYNGIIWFYEGELKDGKGVVAGKKILSIYDDGNTLSEVNPALIWDLAPVNNPHDITTIINKGEATSYAIKAVESYKNEILEERKKQGDIKQKYGVKSLDYYISQLDYEIAELYERLSAGEKVNIVIGNKEEKKKHYEESLRKLIKEIEQETSLTISMPRFIGAILVKPEKSDMVSDEEIEKIGMEIAINYEILQGRFPEDVSRENLGFDIRSRSDGEMRYIEVKARCDEGQIALTSNEWFKAKRFKEQYWLYVVANAVKSPTLYIVNNPVENLEVQKKVEVVRFIVPLEEWKNKGMKV